MRNYGPKTRAALAGASILLFVACLGADRPVDPARPEPFVIEVPPGSSARGMTSALVKQDLIPSVRQWTWFLRTTNAGCVKAGRHEVSRAMSMRQLLAALCSAPLPEDVDFTVVEGWRIRDIDAALAAKGWVEPGEYSAIAESKDVKLPFVVEGPTLEGYLFPETYRVVPRNFNVRDFIERQLLTFQERFLVPYGKRLGERSLQEVVIMASMLEREEPSVPKRPIVAGVLYKRLAAGWKLGVDATSRYTLPVWNDRRAFLKQLRDPNEPYNTRLRGGLPPTPIGNPSLESLIAAIKPQDSAWWYYLHDSEGRFHGARDLAGHEANRRKYNVY